MGNHWVFQAVHVRRISLQQHVALQWNKVQQNHKKKLIRIFRSKLKSLKFELDSSKWKINIFGIFLFQNYKKFCFCFFAGIFHLWKVYFCLYYFLLLYRKHCVLKSKKFAIFHLSSISLLQNYQIFKTLFKEQGRRLDLDWLDFKNNHLMRSVILLCACILKNLSWDLISTHVGLFFWF